ncbi:MAG: PepSY domain-containing protein [Tabrizicola sp.]
MKLKTRLLSYTAAAVLSASAAFAAVDGQSLADQYLAEGYTYVEVTVGPTQTKVEAIKGGVKIEVVYDNETLAVLKSKEEAADTGDQAKTGSKVRTAGDDFEDDDQGGSGHKGHDGSDDDGSDDDHGRDDGSDDDGSDDEGDDDHGGKGDDGDDD